MTTYIKNPNFNIDDSQMLSRIIKRAVFRGSMCYSDPPKLNFEGLSIEEKIVLYIFSWNLESVALSKSTLSKYFGLSLNDVSKIIKSLKGIIILETLFSQKTGRLAGKGYGISLEYL